VTAADRCVAALAALVLTVGCAAPAADAGADLSADSARDAEAAHSGPTAPADAQALGRALDGPDSHVGTPEVAPACAHVGAPDEAPSAEATDAGLLPDAPASCPIGPPLDAGAADLGAPPAPCAKLDPPPWWPPGAAPAPTLAVQLGRHLAGQGWKPYSDGQWAPLQQGGQGGGLFHLAVAPKVLLKGTATPVAELQVQVLAYQACAVVASTEKAKFAFVQATDPDDWYVPDSTKALVAVFAQAGEPGKAKACAAWLHVVARVRALPAGPWGQAQATLRAYDDTAAPVGPKP